ncbi:response regulator transcription factor [Chloroflexi bacterium TSY]|nr:response regulator transcription factor [Chloroflexi bacterium TSY]
MTGAILIVDDEDAVRFFAAHGLARAGWRVYEAASGEAALAVLENTLCDVVLLDLRLDGMDGLTIMRQVKARWPETMIIIMTAYASIDSAIEAVRQDAFDYLRKPCATNDIVSCANRALSQKEELYRRLAHNAVARSAESPISTADSVTEIRCGALTINLGARSVSVDDQPIALTPAEYERLSMLADSSGQPVLHKQLIQDGLGYDPNDSLALETLRVHISRLRRKLGAEYIHTVRGGYMLPVLSTTA